MTRALPTLFVCAAVLAALFAASPAFPGDEVEEVQGVELSSIPPREHPLEQPADCSEDAEDAVCAACTGTAKNFTARRSVTKTSTISTADCVAKVDGIFDTWCSRQNQPADCKGDCPGGKECKPSGQAISTGSSLNIATGVVTCQGQDYLCSCRCR